MLKKNHRKLLVFIICIFISVNVYAGSIVLVDGKKMYKTDEGIYAKDVWLWIDENNDNIAECYRFDSNGNIAINYIHYDGKKTNDKGQYIENDKVIKKLVSTNKLINDDEKVVYGPEYIKDTNKYIIDNVIISDSISKKNQKKIEAGLKWGSETIGEVETINGEIINNTNKKYNPFEDIIAESGVIYSEGVKDNVITINDTDEKIVPGIDAKKFITTSYKFEKDVKEAIIYNGDKWTNCMELKGNKSFVKFLLKKYNYMYFEFSNENHINKNDNSDLIISIYGDNKLIDEIEDFSNGEPQIEEIDLDGYKTVDIKLTVRSGNLQERVYLRNVKFRKIKEE